ncbi:BPSS1780 family membrane protein [uncultured Pseudacidovorax sp.]|uniref:BPSS1780 family membrane protein n=1 Tax=uncultured Pseudacidovorax sp. TaxID=679313 RepID=UPI002600A5E0|nr:BPSS1780 family membrane protein [uncultured Pseudacidovorax sp.]
MKLQIVSPRTGVQWMREGLRAFRRQPMAFFSLFMLFMSAIAMLSVVPLIGGPLAVALGPATTLALMVASEHTVNGRPDPAAGRAASAGIFLQALQAVRAQAKPLAVLGLLYALGALAAGGLATLIFGDPFDGAFGNDGAPQAEVVQSTGFQIAVLARLLFYVPVALAFWHAPALVHWHGVTPVKSIFFSLVACWRNMGAMTLYGLAWAGVVLALSLLMSLVASLLIAVSGAGALGMAVMVGGSFLLSAAFLASAWFTFRDSFSVE